MREAKSVLLIEDEDRWVQKFADQIDSELTLVTADDRTCMDLVEARSFDVIVLDLNLVEVKGDEVLRMIRAVDRRAFVVVWTALPPGHPTVRWFHERGVDVCSKHSDSAGLIRIQKLIKSVSFKEPEDLVALVVDDEREQREAYSAWLRLCGIEKIELAESIGEAAELIEARAFDLFLIDMMFPHGIRYEPSGLELAKELASVGLQDRSSILLVTALRDGVRWLEKSRGLEGVQALPGHGKSVVTKTVQEAIKRGPHRVERRN